MRQPENNRVIDRIMNEKFSMKPINQHVACLRLADTFRLILLCAAITMLAACHGEAVSAEECLDDASVSLAEGNCQQAQTTCHHLLTLVTENDTAHISATQAARLGILFMKLSEHQKEDENVADAMVCLRYAYRMSDDSLRGFWTSLLPEDERHFVLLRRIGMSIDNPVDLSERDMPEDYSREENNSGADNN